VYGTIVLTSDRLVATGTSPEARKRSSDGRANGFCRVGRNANGQNGRKNAFVTYIIIPVRGYGTRCIRFFNEGDKKKRRKSLRADDYDVVRKKIQSTKPHFCFVWLTRKARDDLASGSCYYFGFFPIYRRPASITTKRRWKSAIALQIARALLYEYRNVIEKTIRARGNLDSFMPTPYILYSFSIRTTRRCVRTVFVFTEIRENMFAFWFRTSWIHKSESPGLRIIRFFLHPNLKHVTTNIIILNTD